MLQAPHNPHIPVGPAHSRNFSKHLDLNVPRQRERIVSEALTENTSRNSSVGKVWAEDYYARDLDLDVDCELEFDPDEGGRTDTHTSPLPLYEDEYETRRPRPQQERSLTSLFPSILTSKTPRSKSRSNSPSKTRRKDTEEGEGFMPTLTGDKEGVIKIEDRRGGLASWFTGSSAPVAVGIPVNDMSSSSEDLFSPRDVTPQPTSTPSPGKLKKRQTADSTSTTPTSWRTPWTKTPSKPEPLPTSLAEDELYTLDLVSALFPPTQPTSPSPSAFSPSDYKNLQLTSLSLLQKYQSAYRLRTQAFLELTSLRSAEAEEAEETEMRVRSLRAQLTDMAEKCSAQEDLISTLASSLAEEKRLREEEREAREASIRMIKERAERASKHSSASSLGILSIDGEEARDSDVESLAPDSVFSRSRSPTGTVCTYSSGPSVSGSGTVDSTPELHQASFTRLTSIPNPSFTLTPTSQPQKGPPLPPPKQKSTFAKLLTFSSPSPAPSSAEEEDRYGGLGMSETGCENCRGKESSVAWDTVGLLRAENRGLKDRVGELESAVQGAVDLCCGLDLGR